jgi:hypothetical protein
VKTPLSWLNAIFSVSSSFEIDTAVLFLSLFQNTKQYVLYFKENSLTASQTKTFSLNPPFELAHLPIINSKKVLL